MSRTYSQTIDYLYNSRPYGQIKYGLYRIKELLERLGNPQKACPVVHITGTNGKGSVAATIATVFTLHGLKTGLNVSPHIVSFRERIQLDGHFIKEDEVVNLLEEMQPALEEMDARGEEYSPSFFEVVTAMSFMYYREKKADVAVVEVGLGGRFDASNVIDSALVSIITSVGLDHMNILGDSEEKIAFEKSGIIKSGCPVVTGVTRPSVLGVIEETARNLNSPFYAYWRDFNATGSSYSTNDNSFDYYGDRTLRDLLINLNGEHQTMNAAISLKALELSFEGLCLEMKEETLRKALRRIFWPGRFEVMHVQGKEIILDGAHNPEAAKVLKKTVEIYYPGQRLTLLFGSLDDKDFESNVRALAPVADRVVVCRVPNHRSVHPESVAGIWKKYTSNVEYIDSYREALDTLLKGGEKRFLICGSLYLVSELRNILTGVKEYAGRR